MGATVDKQTIGVARRLDPNFSLAGREGLLGLSFYQEGPGDKFFFNFCLKSSSNRIFSRKSLAFPEIPEHVPFFDNLKSTLSTPLFTTTDLEVKETSS